MCRHSTKVVASKKYPSHRVQVMNGLISLTISLFSILTVCVIVLQRNETLSWQLRLRANKCVCVLGFGRKWAYGLGRGRAS